MTKIARQFGINLSRACEQKGLTHREVAEKAGITEIRMSWYTRGEREPSWVDVHNLAVALGCSPEYLTQDVEDQ